ncbi:N-acetyltransferase family protein [Actinoplanes sp. CA-142083]|uniref:GNAT family N-acetyltransferase n=1 Tax=Actinoplanes sp. CA-142083 TaxID=3239903 RepID=UPI003D8F9B9B
MLRYEQVKSEAALRDWREIHNLIIPTAPLSAEEVEERAVRNHLEVAYLGEVAVGNSTVRPPSEGTSVVIARVLPEYRRRGFGEQLYRRAVEHATAWGATTIETIVLESNDDGLRFALRHGFVEIERYLLPGDTVPFIELRREPDPA